MQSDDKTTPAEAMMRHYADNPAANGFVPISPATLHWWADAMEKLRTAPAEADRRMAAAALLAHAERMLEEADSFRREHGADLRECAAAFRRVAAWMEAGSGR